MKRFIALILAMVTCLSLFACSSAPVETGTEDNKLSNRKLSAEEIFNLISPSTVEINAEGDTFTSTGTGSFIDKNGTVVTNYHVIESCHTINIKIQDGSTYKAESILGFDKDRDLAIIKTACQNKSCVELKTDKIKTGEKVYTLGSSLGLTGTFSEGIISAASREIGGFEFIQTTAPISSGNSGGPLIDEYGKFVGITTGVFTEGQNLNLAIPATAINEISREKTYSINDFFNISQGKEIEKEKDESGNIPESYIPSDIGHFNSLANLEEVTQRNPNSFKFPVVLSVQGTIIRTTDDKLILVHYDDQNFDVELYSFFRKYKNKSVNSAAIPDFEHYCKITMRNDSENRALTGDKVVITGMYTYSAKTLSDCTFGVLAEGTDFIPANMGQFNSLADLKEVAQRNPGNFSFPVVLSVQGLVIRTTNNKIYLVYLPEKKTNEELYYLSKIERGELIDEEVARGFSAYCCVVMIDDTTNRVLTGDIVTVTGTYRYSTQTIYNSTYQMIGKYEMN